MGTGAIKEGTLEAVRIRVRGVVQGVGFRPFVYRLARFCALRGAVWNDPGGVVIEAVGEAAAIATFTRALRRDAPPAARVEEVSTAPAPHLLARVPDEFRIVASRAEGESHGVGPDLATCADCLRELFDPADRRYRYPFINCTNCGPRLSILDGTPYDRPRTTMAAFAMCARCRREYEDPGDRRFHAQPNACPACGPRARFERCADGVVLGGWEEIGDAFWALIGAGGSVAIKGIGGYHLACLASDEVAVRRLRERKRRPHKPLAVMAGSLAVLRRHVEIGPGEATALFGADAPILLLRPRDGCMIAPAVAPGQHRIGAMLPYSPLHHLLLEGRDEVLVMTSGNLSERPQIIDDGEAHAAFSTIADAILGHDRKIAVRVDDSVARFDGRRPTWLRLGRGLAPLRLPAPPGLAGAPDIVALGAQLKATFCLKQASRLVLSQHIGDLEHAENRDALAASLRHYLRLYDLQPALFAQDLHPDAASSGLADELVAETGARLVRVQHHHAHAAACLAEHRYPHDGAPVLAIVLDGQGFGPDGALWGFEFLEAGYASCRRLAHLRPVPMPGGEAAIREPWRMAFSHVAELGDLATLRREHPRLPLFLRHGEREVGLLLKAAERGLNAPLTTSCGRLFDAVAALLGICERVTYEGQAAAELEALLWQGRRRAAPGEAYRLEVVEGDAGVAVLDPRPLWPALLADLTAGRSPGEISHRFHAALLDAILAMTRHLGERHPELRRAPVVLSGGAFQNAFLLRALRARLARTRRRVLTHHKLPPNDGGLSVGQAAIAAAINKG